MITAPSDAGRVTAMYRDLGGADLSDSALVHAVSRHVRLPRDQPADSFVLHAPLELLARAALLPWVTPRGRELARLRLVALQVQFDSAPAADVDPEPEPGDPELVARTLAGAVAAADLEATDVAASRLARSAPAVALPALLGDAMLPGLAAAGHAPIFLYQYPRTAPRGEASAGLLRPLARELARHPHLRIEWVADRPAAGGSAAALAESLRGVPVMGVPGSTFIFPVMHQVDASGVAADLLGPSLAGVSPDDAARVLLRVAARAMLVGVYEHIPFGWSHCLTMPQAALGIAGAIGIPQLAVDVAATYVVGFLAALATEPIPESTEFPNPGGTFGDALAAGREAVAGWVQHAPPSELPRLRSDIATRACGRRDAHIVKYSLACLDAAAADPDAERLFLAAAAALLAFWTPIDEPDDPLQDVMASMT